MFEVRAEDGAFVVFDTDARQPVLRFDDRHDADRLVAELQAHELHAALERLATDRAHVPI